MKTNITKFLKDKKIFRVMTIINDFDVMSALTEHLNNIMGATRSSGWYNLDDGQYKVDGDEMEYISPKNFLMVRVVQVTDIFHAHTYAGYELNTILVHEDSRLTLDAFHYLDTLIRYVPKGGEP